MYKYSKPVIAFDKLNKSDGELNIFFIVHNEIWWKMSLAIVFSELTCINGNCSILGLWVNEQLCF